MAFSGIQFSFSIMYLHIKYPVRLSPCVQCTPMRVSSFMCSFRYLSTVLVNLSTTCGGGISCPGQRIFAYCTCRLKKSSGR